MKRRFLTQTAAVLGLGLLSVFSAFAQTAPKLVIDQPVEQEIKGGQVNVFMVDIPARYTARIVIEQNGIDVSLAALKRSGERFIESESPSGMKGADWILVTASESGEYKIEVTPADPRAASGRLKNESFDTMTSTPKGEGEVKITAVAADSVSGEINLSEGDKSVKGTFTAKLPKK